MVVVLCLEAAASPQGPSASAGEIKLGSTLLTVDQLHHKAADGADNHHAKHLQFTTVLK